MVKSRCSRAIAPLFPEILHLIVTEESGIDSFSELKGKRIALMPQGSGSYQIFWALSSHYGLSSQDFVTQALSPPEANEALWNRKVDALFRVIALGNPTVERLLLQGRTKLVPIEQGAAIQLFHPALFPSTIPQGTYNGALPIPPQDLNVVALDAVLVTREDLRHNLIYEITRILFEAGNELATQNIQAAMIPQPDESPNLRLPFHDGARAYYYQDRPSFIVEYAEPLGLLLSISVLVISGLWQLRIWFQGKQKNRGDFYNLEVLQLIERINSLEDLEQLTHLRHHLFEILRQVVVDLDEDRVSLESFQSFTFTWQVAMMAISHREALLLQ